ASCLPRRKRSRRTRSKNRNRSRRVGERRFPAIIQAAHPSEDPDSGRRRRADRSPGLRYRRIHPHTRSIAAAVAPRSVILAGDSITRLGPLHETDLNVLSIYELCLKHFGRTITIEFVHPAEKISQKKQLTIE